MKTLLQHVRSRGLAVTVGIVSAIIGLCCVAFGIWIGLAPLGLTSTRPGHLLAASIILVIGLPPLLYGSRLVFPRLRASHGGIVGPIGLQITGVFLLILPVVFILTREWGHLLLQFLHVGLATTCFALARAQRRAAREVHTPGPAPIRPD